MLTKSPQYLIVCRILSHAYWVFHGCPRKCCAVVFPSSQLGVVRRGRGAAVLRPMPSSWAAAPQHAPNWFEKWTTKNMRFVSLPIFLSP